MPKLSHYINEIIPSDDEKEVKICYSTGEEVVMTVEQFNLLFNHIKGRVIERAWVECTIDASEMMEI